MKKLSVHAFFFFLFSFFAHLNAQIISTYAGNAIIGYSGDGGQATNAELNLPVGIRLDDSGNIYIAEFGNNIIRSVISSTGMIKTFAGIGYNGYSGNGGLAIAAELNTPTDMAFDSVSDMYICDNGNNVIRMVSKSTGIITTVAGNNAYPAYYTGDGGPATDAELDTPYGIALDKNNNIYIADYLNNVIRKVTASSGIISTIVGNGYGHWHGPGTWTGNYSGDGGPATAAEMYGPDAITLDTMGNIYIADDRNCVIRKVTVSTGIITTMAGNGVRGYIGDGGPATVAELSYTYGITLDKYGNMYISEENDVVRKVTTTGIITTIAGNGIYGYSGDGGFATAAELNTPNGIAFDTVGNMYIVDEGNNVIRKVTNAIATGFNQQEHENGITVFPNPNSGIFTVNGIRQEQLIEIYNCLGQKLQTFQASNTFMQVDLSAYASGVYIAVVRNADGSKIWQGKVVKIR